MATCAHDDALLVEQDDKHPDHQSDESSIFYCVDCGDYLDESGEITLDPTLAVNGVSNVPKVSHRPRTYNRGRDMLITVMCSWPLCRRKFQIFPQNKRPKNWCPEIHRAIVNQQQVKERQKRFRKKHKSLSVGATPSPAHV